ncbi:DUF1330 domain-containing protein [Caulobacter mirabilis]|uniref:DUF1330 domain-containing protein n=1 Tax=Caulobacter mirabilis TaxID=69666 RepID=A0A2D2B224_9CAUL|nr:DUF1330 domain-containing protein [Caulobacter mirabilis]ATQ44256.1 hypothetical protein CSW64_18615 [Caulobacter mirabilis]
MPAFVIMLRDETLDPEEFATYGKKAPAARGEHKITPRAFYGKHEVLEGDDVEGAVILEFPTFEEAKAWYDSPAYQEALQHRLKGATYRVLIVQGV